MIPKASEYEDNDRSAQYWPLSELEVRQIAVLMMRMQPEPLPPL
jgi:hypothetical protein